MKTVESEGYYFIWCEGCQKKHLIPKTPSANGSKWSFNGSFERPTFSPSVRISWNEGEVPKMCHFTITDGRIEFHSDCLHEQAGKILEMKDL